MTGIVGFGAYLPALRLQREQILAAHGWLNPGLKLLAKGELATCNWDEDALTMAVEASRSAVTLDDRKNVARLLLASATLPFEGRLGGAVLTEALGLDSSVLCLDTGGSPRCGLTSLRTALELPAAQDGVTLCVAADQQKAQPASAHEMSLSSGAASFVIGRDKVLARYLGGLSHTTDFVDRFRVRGGEYDVHWEDRWIRDEGYLKMMPDTIRGLLARLNVAPGGVQHLAVGVSMPGVPAAVAAAVGIAADRVVDNLFDVCGNGGSAYPLLLLISALERAEPGERILVCAFGQGSEALLIEATGELATARPRLHGTRAALARRIVECNYLRHLTTAGQLDVDTGMRGAAHVETPLSVAYRERQTLLGFVGGRCTVCGTVQFPRVERCVNPGCHANGRQDPVNLAERRGSILTWTADRLACSPRPPLYYGMVQFDEGGRVLMEFADVDEQCLDAGTPVRMVFRRHRATARHGHPGYFWKATPLMAEAAR